MKEWPYDALYRQGDYSKYLPDFSRRQRVAAQALAERLFPTALSASHRPEITRIIDVGCGDGSILRALLDELGPRWRGEVVGYERSAPGLERARLVLPEANFILVADETDLREHLAVDLASNAESTAVLVVGHTWFHFREQEALLATIKRGRPGVLAVDFHENWDAAISRLKEADAPSYVDHLLVVDGEYVRALRTQTFGPGEVQRGLVRFKPGSSEVTWSLPTIQTKETSYSLLGSANDHTSLESASKAGSIVGGCDYFVTSSFQHDSGWGRMHAHILLRLDATARRINGHWAAAMKHVVRKLFVEPTAERAIANLRPLLEFFNETRTDPLSGHREAALIMPFDPIATFARMVGMLPNSDDRTLGKHDLLLELPNSAQHRFPTAYGLYHTLLDNVSSPQAFALRWAPNYQRSPVDEQYEELEKALLRLDEFGPNANPEFSIVPIYFGSLPLFCLVLKFPESLRDAAISADIFRSVLKNLHDQIRVVIDDGFVRSAILPDFIARILSDIPSGDADHKTSEIEAVLAATERLLFGRPAADENGDCRGGAIHKRWKSWILTLPSHEIVRMPSVRAENQRLRHLWNDARDDAIHDNCTRISRWFSSGRFFEDWHGIGHDSWSCEHHLPRLARMFNIAGVAVTSAELTDTACFAKSTDALAEAPYFILSRGHFLFEWMIQQIQRLGPLAKSCRFAPKCVVPLGEAMDCPRTDETFPNLKAVFCRTLENRGARHRFGVRRLVCIAQAASRGKCSVTPLDDINLFGWETAGLETKLWSDDDPTPAIGELIHLLVSMEIGNSSIVRAVRITADVPVVRIAIDFADQLSPRGGGSHFAQAQKHVEFLTSRGLLTSDKLLDASTLPIEFHVKSDGKQLQFIPVCSS